MSIKTSFRLMLLMAIMSLFALPIAAQDDSAETLAPEPITASYGPMNITTLAPWQVTEGRDGVVALTTFDVLEASQTGEFPVDGIIAQIRLIGIPRINLGELEVNAENIMGGLLFSQGATVEAMPAITLIESDNYTFARVDITEEGGAPAFLYTVIFTDTTFGIITATSEEGLTSDGEADMLATIDTLTFDFEAPFPEGATERYDNYTVGISEAGFPRLGDPDALVTVVEISSFDCPHCGTFHEIILPALLERILDGDVRFVYIPVYGTGNIANGDNAARAALCVGEDNFWAFHDALFSWQAEFGNYAFMYERLQNAALSLGISTEDFTACFTDDATTATLQTAVRVVQEQVPENFGTPTVIVNGVRIDVSVSTINAAIDAAIADTETNEE